MTSFFWVINVAEPGPDHLQVQVQSPSFVLPNKLKPFIQVSSLIIGFLKTTQLFSPNPLGSLHIVRVEMLLFSPLNIAVSSTFFFFLSDRDRSRLFSDYISFNMMVPHDPSSF